MRAWHALLVLLGGCLASSLDPSALDASRAAASAGEARRWQEDALREARAHCAPWERYEPSLEEEQALGWAMLRRELGADAGLLVEGADAGVPDGLGRTVVSPDAGVVARVGRAIARFSSRPGLPWGFAVFEEDAPTARHGPGGAVVVSTGLLKAVSGEAQLAGVLAHEIAHVAGRHRLVRSLVARQRACEAARVAASLSAREGTLDAETMRRLSAHLDRPGHPAQLEPGFVSQLSLQLASLGEPPDVELETDRAAADLLAAAGYDAAPYAQWLADHPAPLHPPAADRAARLGHAGGVPSRQPPRRTQER